ncbi:hypothetical protein ACIB24_16025 [Spongisporangium articulatum]|uniref:Uncharacterized protein n=1 Tax=Spongisporangium articulatum TaxID=3362603 RepID=A0ABW8ARJ0_9ACTN
MVPDTALATVPSIDGRTGHQVDRLRRQVEVMLAHALDKGLTPAPQAWMFDAVRDPNAIVDLAAEGWNPTTTDDDRRQNVEALVRAHRDLSRLVAPARPATLELLADYRERRRPARRLPIPRQKGAAAPTPPKPGGRRPRTLGTSVPLVRWLLFATLVALVVFVGFSAVPQARAASAGVGLGEGISGISELSFGTLLLRELFLLVGAGLGACLISLYRAGKEVGRGTYDPEFDHTYLQRILLGMATGLILAELLPLGSGSDTPLSGLARPAVALLGGFAAEVVHSVLNRVIGALEALFNGDAEEQEEARRELAQKRADEVLAQAERATLTKLLEIRRIASSGAPARAVIDEIDRVISLVSPS